MLLLGPAWAITLVALGLTSDTNAAGERVETLPTPSSERALDRKVA